MSEGMKKIEKLVNSVTDDMDEDHRKLLIAIGRALAILLDQKGVEQIGGLMYAGDETYELYFGKRTP